MSHPSHVKIDGASHTITKIEEHADGPQHTHRAHLACGMTMDVDIGGVRKHARHTQRSKEHDMPEWQVKHVEIAEQALTEGETWDHERWLRGATPDCAHCAAFEAGTKQPVTHEQAHTKANTRLADINTGLPCPMCGSPLYIRRQGGDVACTGHGHQFKVDEVLATGMGLLHKLATGAAEVKGQ